MDWAARTGHWTLPVPRKPQDLDAPGKVELAIVAAGARTDLDQLDAAVAELEIPQLDINRAFSYSPRLFRAYADASAAVGRTRKQTSGASRPSSQRTRWARAVDEEPDIIDLGWDEEEEAREEAERRRLANTQSAERSAADAPKPPKTAAQKAADARGRTWTLDRITSPLTTPSRTRIRGTG